MPVVGRNAPREPSNPLPQVVGNAAELAQFELDESATTTAEHQPAETGEIDTHAVDVWQQQREHKPFFTQIGTTVENKQHNRVVMVVPLLLIVSLLLIIFAYVASK